METIMLETFLFYLLTAGILVSAIGVVASRSPIYSVLSLVVTLCLLAGYFVLLKAYLVATIMVLVYAGAILVLFLFVTMLVDFRTVEPVPSLLSPAFLTSGAVAGGFIFLLISTIRNFPSPQEPPLEGTTEAIGRLLFSRYALPFELTAFLVLAAVVAVVVLAKKDARI